MAIDRMKWLWTAMGFRSVSTVTPPSPIWARTPTTSETDSHTRSERKGRRRIEARTATMTAMETRPVTTRLRNSTDWCHDSSPTRLFFSHVGQSGQPRPEPERRTKAPVTMMAATDQAATRVMRW